MRLSSDLTSACPPVRFEEAPIPGHASVFAQVIELCLPGAGDADRPRINLPERGVIQALRWIGKELPLTIKICSLAIHDRSRRDVCRGEHAYVRKDVPGRMCKLSAESRLESPDGAQTNSRQGLPPVP